MTHLEKLSSETEQTKFNNKFIDKNKSYMVTFDMNGNLISIDTKDKEIIAYVKKLGLK